MMAKRKRKVKELVFEEYVEMFCGLVQRPERVDHHTYRGRCPVCGDSKKVKNKKRLYIMRDRGRKPCMVYCHNCGLAKPAYHFFESEAPDELNKRKKSLSQRDLDDLKKFAESGGKKTEVFYNTIEIEEISPQQYCKVLQEEVDKAKMSLNKFFTQFTYSVSENPEAYSYLTGRCIPDEHIQEMLLLKPEYHDRRKFRFAYFRDYIMVPFIDKSDTKPYYFHARRYRNLNQRFSRFLFCPYRPENVEVNFFLNEMRVDPKHPIIISEGTYDSLNLENCISAGGVKKITDEQIARFEYRFGGAENIIYALDNEMIDNDAKKISKKLLKLGKKVFLWSLMAKDFPFIAEIKDFNSLCQRGKRTILPTETLIKYTATNPATVL